MNPPDLARQIEAYLKKHTGFKVDLEGYTLDINGPDGTNLKLSWNKQRDGPAK